MTVEQVAGRTGATGADELTKVHFVEGPRTGEHGAGVCIGEPPGILDRVAASLKYGHVTASLIAGKLSRADRQNTLAAALKEYGPLRRTVYAARPGPRGLPPQDLPAASRATLYRHTNVTTARDQS